MKFISSAALAATVLASTITALVPREKYRRDTSYQETFTSQNLIGDHSGVPGFPKTFDYVIVGGGTAGNTLARRLAANPKFSVALIEAGGFYETDNGNLTDIPANAVYFIDAQPVIRNNLIDWYQFTTPQAVSIYSGQISVVPLKKADFYYRTHMLTVFHNI
jgi:thioredoxin reductase